MGDRDNNIVALPDPAAGTTVQPEKAMPEVGPYRPPSEAYSLFVRATRNCEWDRCKFCILYKGEKYEVRPLKDVLEDIDKTAGGEYHSAFIQDADPLSLPTSHLVEILTKIRQVHPGLSRITTYATARSMYRKSPDELNEIRAAGLSRIHRGLETGYDALLKYMMKGSTQRIQIEGGRKVKEAGFELSDYVMPGLAGDLELEGGPAWIKHAEETARVINAVNPNYVRLRTFIIHSKCGLASEETQGKIRRLPDPEIVKEIRLFVDRLDGITTRLESDHELNLLMELEGTFPQDKAAMLALLDRYLALPELQQHEFRLARLFLGCKTLDKYLDGFKPGEIIGLIAQSQMKDSM